MTRGFTEKLHWENGYFVNQNIVGDFRYKNGLAIGSKNVFMEGKDRIRSWDGPKSFGSFGNRIMHLVGAALGTLASGNIIRFRDNMTWVVGSGTVKLGTGGTGNTFTGSAQNYLQFVNGFGTLQRAGVPGILTPPTLRVATLDGNPNNTNASNQIVGRNNGEVSVRVSTVAFDTKSEGNASPPSASVNFANQAAQILFPATTIPGRNAGYRVYSSRKFFGKDGPWEFLVEIPAAIDQTSFINASNVVKNANNPTGIDQSAFSGMGLAGLLYTWTDGDLKAVLAPIANFAPPDGATHLFSLGDLMILVYPAGRLLASFPGFPEAYPIEFERFLDPQEDVIAVRGRQGDGWQYLACRNSLHAANLLEDEINPLETRAIWPSCGISGPNALAFWHDILYAFSEVKGFVRTAGRFGGPESEFGIDVESDLVRLAVDPAECCIGWHQTEDCMVYFFGDVAFVYKVKLGTWCAPFYIQDGGVAAGQRVVGCETLNGKLVFSTTDGSMYEFSGGNSTTLPWKAIPFWRSGGSEGEGYPLNITHYLWSYEIPMGRTIKAILRTNFDLSTAAFDPGPAPAGKNGIARYSQWAKIDQHNDMDGNEIKAFTLEFQGLGGNCVVLNGTVLGGYSSMRV